MPLKHLQMGVYKHLIFNSVQVVLIPPESLIVVPKYRNILLSKTYQEKLVVLVVDDAHYVKKWGDRFRTAFAQIGELRSIMP